MQKLIRGLDAFNRWSATIVKWLVSACVAVQVIIVFCGVIWRYFLHSPITWVDEVAALLLVVIAFLGCYIALTRNGLARIELLISKFKGPWKKAVYVLSELLTLVMLVVAVVYGVKLFLLPTSLNQSTPGLYIPLSIFYGLIPITFLLCCISTITKILHYIFDKEEDSEC